LGKEDECFIADVHELSYANQMVIVIKGHCKMLRLLFQNWIDTAKEPGRAKKELMYT